MSRGLAIYPGSFDPTTLGHLDLMRRGLAIFDELVVAITDNPSKTHLFNLEERVEMLREATLGWNNLRIDTFRGLLVDYVHAIGARVILRGLRAVSDFEYEFQMALTNRKLSPDIETIYMMPSEEYTYLNSRVIREVASLGGSVCQLVPNAVERRLREKFPYQKERS